MAGLEIKNISKKYGKVPAVRNISLDFPDGEFTVLVGPSGCGKTTTLRMIAGLETVDEGQILLDGQLINLWPPRARDMAMVFQRYSLYPHLTVRDNISFGLKARRCPPAEIIEKVDWISKMLHITHLLDRRQGQLSGGEQQRVAIGRALVRSPKVYLLDEPLSNLDAKLRIEMREELKRLHQKMRTTTIYVTHDQAEAMSLGDRLVVMNEGRIMANGRPLDVYYHPENIFVAGFIGNPAMNLIEGRVRREDGALSFYNQDMNITLPERLARALEQPGLNSGDEFFLGVRPEHICRGEGVRGEAIVMEPLGAETLVLMQFGASEVRLKLNGQDMAAPGDNISCSFAKEHLHLFHKSSGVSVEHRRN